MRTHVDWAGVDIHRRLCTEHFITVGASGSGKTTLIKLLMKSVFPDPVIGLVYDPKPEFLPLLFQLKKDTNLSINNGTSKVKVLNPFDMRCCAWDMAKDITGPVTARQIATILVPDADSHGSSDNFFIDAVRDLLTGVMLAFIECVPNEGSWQFSDVILTMLYEPYLRFILGLSRTRGKLAFPVLERLQKSYLEGDEKTVSNIRATINSKLSVYEPIAAMWNYAIETDYRRKVSITDWAKGGFSEILVLGNDESARYSIDALNKAFFKRATECLLSRSEQNQKQQDTGCDQVWVILDEVREAGKLDGLSSLMTKGRSKGVCMVLGFQDINGLRDVYGEEVANEIVAQCNNVAIMRINSPETAQWASDLFGRRKLNTQSKDTSYGGEGTMQYGGGSSEQELPYLFSADFLYLPLPRVAKYLNGYMKDSDIDPEKNFDDLKFKVFRKEQNTEEEQQGEKEVFSEYHRCTDESLHYLHPWDESDWERLGLKKIKKTPLEYNTPTGQIPKVSWGSDALPRRSRNG